MWRQHHGVLQLKETWPPKWLIAGCPWFLTMGLLFWEIKCNEAGHSGSMQHTYAPCQCHRLFCSILSPLMVTITSTSSQGQWGGSSLVLKAPTSSHKSEAESGGGSEHSLFSCRWDSDFLLNWEREWCWAASEGQVTNVLANMLALWAANCNPQTAGCLGIWNRSKEEKSRTASPR